MSSSLVSVSEAAEVASRRADLKANANNARGPAAHGPLAARRRFVGRPRGPRGGPAISHFIVFYSFLQYFIVFYSILYYFIVFSSIL